jgi:hypothetical protein
VTRSIRALVVLGAFVATVTAPAPVRALGRACAATQLHVAVVVDHGTGTSVSSVCVSATARDNGATLLAARASMLGLPQPRYDASGLLCAIDGLPERGCGEGHGGKYAYWSYWHGTGGAWSYANVGPASTRAKAEVVEGWRWQPAGSAGPSDPPPRARPDASTVCVAASVATSTTAPARTTSLTTTPAVVTAGSTAVSPSDMPVAVPTSVSAVPTALAIVSVPSTAETSRTIVAPDVIAAGVPVARTGGSGGGAPVGLIVGVVLVAAVGIGGGVVARRRRGELA